MAYETKEMEGYSYPADFYQMGAIIYEMVRNPLMDRFPLIEGISSAFRELV